LRAQSVDAETSERTPDERSAANRFIDLGVAILEPRPTVHEFNELGQVGLFLTVA